MTRCSIVLLLLIVAGCAIKPNPLPLKSAVRTFFVQGPNGKPIAGAEAVLVPAGHAVDVIDGERFDDDPAYQRSQSDVNGQIHFADMNGDLLLAVISPAGYCTLDGQALLKRSDVILRPWAKVKGKLKIGKNPAVGEKVIANCLENGEQDGTNKPWANAYSEAITDSQGNFVIDRVPPGNLLVSREVNIVVRGVMLAGGTTQRVCIHADPGQILNVSLGGTGQQATGRLIIPPELVNRADWDFGIATAVPRASIVPPPMPPDIAGSSLSVQQDWYKDFINTAAGKSFLTAASNHLDITHQPYPVEISSDKTFTLEDLPAGSFNLNLEIRTGINPLPHSTGKIIATAQIDFTIPPSSTNGKPVEIPPVAMTMVQPTLKAGSAAPNIIAQTLDGQPMTVSQFRGKTVLLVFWATWCGPCKGEIPQLQEIFKRFGNDDHFAMVSLSVDDLPFEPKRLVDSLQLPWIQGFVGPNSSAESIYAANGIPGAWLIGPDGSIIKKVSFGGDPAADIAAALRH
jgi:thiol-disulfide isomerase/thioredoxin